MRLHQEIWRSVARVVIALFLLRAMIPVGFMPDLKALQDGRVEITLCTADGLKTVLAESPGHSKDSGQDRSSDSNKPVAGDHCPFGSVATQAVALAAAGTATSATDAYVGPVFPAFDPSPRDVAQGPPLGSRAPPAVISA